MGLGQHLKLMLARAERDALRDELEARNAEIEQLRAQSDEWRDVAARVVCVLIHNNIKMNGEYYAKCLNEVRAEAGRAGYIQALKDFSESDFKAADIYAAKVREGGEQ